MAKKETKKKRSKISEMFYYANPRHLSQEVAGLGYTLSAKKTIASYLAFMAAALIVGWLFELKPIPMIILVMSGFIFIPTIIHNGYKNMYEQQRFSEVTEYMEHMLYSFRSTRKILQSLNEVELSFREGPMYDAIQDAKREILTGSRDGGVERSGLKIIEKRYPCERLRAIHKFMIEVEYLGGNFDESIDLLLEDRMAWVDRTTVFQKDKKHQVLNVALSIGITALVCLLIQRALPDTVSITNNIVFQVVTLLMLIIDITIIVSVIVLITCGGLALLTKPFFIAFGVVFASFAYFLPGIKYNSSKKALETEIAIKFPQWLKEVSLQLQSQNVQVALFNSIPTAPEVLKPELIKLKKRLDNEPESVIPYFDFMRDFIVPEIQSSMKMLYSISAGTGGDSNKQIAEIIRRNNMLLDKSEKNAFENVLAGMYGLFLSPQIAGGAKKLTDMIIFFVIFMGQLTV